MNRTSLLATLACVAFASAARAQQAPAPAPDTDKTVHVDSLSKLPPSYPHDVPIPQGVRPVSATERKDGSLAIVFEGAGRAAPLREAYEAALPERGWKLQDSDRVGEEQGLSATKGERTLWIFFEERGGQLRVQLAHVPKTAAAAPPAPK